MPKYPATSAVLEITNPQTIHEGEYNYPTTMFHASMIGSNDGLQDSNV